MQRVLAPLMLVLLAGLVHGQSADETEKLRQQLKELEKRLQKVEKTSAQDRIRFGGDFRFEAHSIAAKIPISTMAWRCRRAW